MLNLSPGKITDEMLIAWHAEEVNVYVLAKREGCTTREIKRGWQRLRRAGLLAHKRVESDGEVKQHEEDERTLPRWMRSDTHDYDGRPSVGKYDDDPLLMRLYEVHHEPREDLFAGPAPSPPRDATSDHGSPG